MAGGAEGLDGKHRTDATFLKPGARVLPKVDAASDAGVSSMSGWRWRPASPLRDTHPDSTTKTTARKASAKKTPRRHSS